MSDVLAIYASTALILAASLLLGRGILALARWPAPAWLSGATGFAALVIVSPFLLRLPGRATTAAIVVGILLLGAAAILILPRVGGRRRPPFTDPPGQWLIATAVVAIVVALATLPFLFNDRVGVLGMGIYTNDHAAQLFWADWLQHGFGPEPSGVRFGYPIGPQSVAVIAAEASGTSLVSAFNGLLLAIPALTGLTALAALARLGPLRRIAVAAICGLPYLGASFLAQSAFKETAMALFVLAFALALASVGRAGWRGVLTVGVLTAGASVFTYSIPGLVWFAGAVGIWLLVTALVGESPVDWRRMRAALIRHRATSAVVAIVVIAVVAIAIGPAIDFASRVDDVQASAGRLSSPVFGGEALGIWPEGDFRIVRGEVSGAYLAIAIGAVALAYGVWALLRRRRFALVSMLAAGLIAYLGTRAFAEIHVQAKALAVIAPLVLLIGLRALLGAPEPRAAATAGWRPRIATLVRYAFGAVVLVAALGSTLLALRAAPVGFDDRSAGLERLAERVEGESVVFLGVDRFASYDLRGTLVRGPAGYMPADIAARPEKPWQQGRPGDFDMLAANKLDQFDYAITTTAAYASTPPPNFEPVERSGDYLLLERRGPTPERSRVLAEGGAPGAILDCAGADGRFARLPGTAVVLGQPAVADYLAWDTPRSPEPAAAGQGRGFEASGRATIEIDLPAPGRYELSLQYHSQVPLKVEWEGETLAELPPSLDGMYLSGAGRGAFWPAGELRGDEAGAHRITVRALAPTGLQDALGVERRVWLGDLAASPVADPRTVPLVRACGRYVDHLRLDQPLGSEPEGGPEAEPAPSDEDAAEPAPPQEDG